MRAVSIIAIAVLISAVAFLVEPAERNAAQEALAQRGYPDARIQGGWFGCLKGRWGFAWTDGQERRGHVCVGGLMGPAVTISKGVGG